MRGLLCGLLGLALVAASSPHASADEECDRWLKIASLHKRKVILQSFDQQKTVGRDVVRDRCIKEAASSILSEVDAACRKGAELKPTWASSGLAWSVICGVVLARTANGDRVTQKERQEIRSAWDSCVEREGDPDPCRKLVVERFALGQSRTDTSECEALVKLLPASGLNEVYDRIRMRFSATEEVADCLRGYAKEIEREVKQGCRGPESNAFVVWEQVLTEHTDRCLGRDTIF